MFRFFQRFIKDHDHGRQNRNAADHAKDNTFHHNDTQVKTEGKAHKAKSQETCDSGDGAADHGFNGSGDGFCHGFVMIIRQSFQLFLIAVPQKNGVIHGHAQLQDRAQCFGEVGYFSGENVASQVIENGHADACKKQHGNQEGFHGQGQHDGQ